MMTQMLPVSYLSVSNEENICSKVSTAGQSTKMTRRIGDISPSFKEQPVAVKNGFNDELNVNQVDLEGVLFVRDYLEFSKFFGKKIIKRDSISVSQKTG